jgi:hypothetical protein
VPSPKFSDDSGVSKLKARDSGDSTPHSVVLQDSATAEKKRQVRVVVAEGSNGLGERRSLGTTEKF